MLVLLSRCSLVLILGFAITFEALPQTPKTQKPTPPPPADAPAEPPQDIDTLKTDTNLVSVPVIAADLSGVYVPDLTREEFSLLEDGVPHQIAFFATVSAPFNVVLMIDTSASTEDKLKLIQDAADTFVQQLQPGDRVKVVSFDDRVVDHNEFTNDRQILKSAIYKTRSGKNTKVYDAFDLALSALRPIRGRKAIVLFTDGVDWHSDYASAEGNLRGLDEEGVIVYPIRYDTREQTERIAREQSEQMTPELPTRDVIRRPAPGTTPPTFPSEEPSSVPSSGTTRRTGPFGLPPAEEILRRRRESERRREQERNPGQYPDQFPQPGEVPPERRAPIPGPTTERRDRRQDDSIKAMLDLHYMKADAYLEQLAEKSAGRLLRADVLSTLPAAFANIAAELRTQYLLGYYPLKTERDEKYRRIKVSTTRKNVKLRARPGYLATAARRSLSSQ